MNRNYSMDNQKQFAIVTPVKDEINHFPRTVKSIINQELKPQKWIIIDDGSTDGTTFTKLVKLSDNHLSDHQN